MLIDVSHVVKSASGFSPPSHQPCRCSPPPLLLLLLRLLFPGGFRPQAQVASEAVRVLNQAKALQASGCFAIVLECIPAPIAAAVTKALRIPTIGIGAGPQCSGQVRVGGAARIVAVCGAGAAFASISDRHAAVLDASVWETIGIGRYGVALLWCCPALIMSDRVSWRLLCTTNHLTSYLTNV
jgi:hypothetical protein